MTFVAHSVISFNSMRFRSRFWIISVWMIDATPIPNATITAKSVSQAMEFISCIISRKKRCQYEKESPTIYWNRKGKRESGKLPLSFTLVDQKVYNIHGRDTFRSDLLRGKVRECYIH